MALENILQQHDIDTSSLILPEYQRVGEGSLIYLTRFPVDEVLAQWEALRQLVPETGYWPMIGWERFKQPPWEEESVEDILEESERVDVQEWFEQE